MLLKLNYQTFQPSQDLSTIVKCYWTLETPATSDPDIQTIVPDGCMEMIFHQGDLFRQYLDEDKFIIQPRCFVIGQLTHPLKIQPTGKTRIFSVRFHPGGFMPFLSRPVSELENKAVPLDFLFGIEGKRLSQKILNEIGTGKQIHIIEEFLTKNIMHKDTIDRIIRSTVDSILTANGQLPIHQLSQQLKINRRQLERKFSSKVGLSLKQLSKIVRLQATLKLLLNSQYTNLTDVAYEGNYYDQSHFIKDFKELTGFTPKEFYKDNFTMSALFYSS